jgi:hypothetical protein
MGFVAENPVRVQTRDYLTVQELPQVNGVGGFPMEPATLLPVAAVR